MHLHFHANQSHKNGFALTLALKQRHKELGNGLLQGRIQKIQKEGNENFTFRDTQYTALWAYS